MITNQIMKTMLCSAVGLAVLVAGCEKGPAGRADQAGVDNHAAGSLPADLFVTSAPENPVSVMEGKKRQAEQGAIVMEGRIGGKREPFVSEMAMFTLVDLSLKQCNERDDDGCPTPWDYCCENPKALKAAMAMVQVVGEDGKPLRVNIEGESGLKPAAAVTIAGTIGPSPQGVLVVNATKIHVRS